MTVLDEPRTLPPPEEPHPRPSGMLAWLTTTDHKTIGLSYIITAFGFFLMGGVLALLIRLELWDTGLQIVTANRFNQLFTMHGSIMMFLFIGPIAFGLANYLVPIQVGAPDMAFPRLNAFSYWLYLGGGLTMVSGFLTSEGAANFGWTAYPPLSLRTFAPAIGADLWIIGLLLTGFSAVFTAVNIVATVASLRAPGMRLFRMPIFTWNMVVTSVLILMAFPVITAAGIMLFADRHFGTHLFNPEAGGSPILWQHLFWFFGHPEVYIVALPFFGIITEVIATFSRRPIFGYRALVFATFLIAAYSMGAWAHHMFVTGAVLLPFFSGITMLVAVPTGVKFFNWLGTMWGGSLRFPTSMLFALGFMVTFLLGGISGVQLASAPLDFQASDTYFVVAHMHYVLFGGSVFALYAGLYYWFPKFTGRRLGEGLGKVHFALSFVGFHLTFLIQHQAGLNGMARRIADYVDTDGLGWMNRLSSAGSGVLGLSTMVFLWNVWRSWKKGEVVGDDPWDGQTLEWATPSPPPAGNFVEPLPPIRSNRPVWDAKYPEATQEATAELGPEQR
jgi:cytochrome c oxidase subunit I